MSWRKLLTDPPVQWQALPLLARGVATEMLRRVPGDAIIPLGGVAPHLVVARMTGAHVPERRGVKRAVEALLDGGWLSLDGDVLRLHLPDAGRPTDDRRTTVGRPTDDRGTTVGRPWDDRGTTDGRPWHDTRGDLTVRNHSPPLKKERKKEREKETHSQISSQALDRSGAQPPAARSPSVDLGPTLDGPTVHRLFAEHWPDPRMPKPRQRAWDPVWDEISIQLDEHSRVTRVDPETVLRRVLAGFFGSDWARSKGYPVAALLNGVGRYWLEGEAAEQQRAKGVGRAYARYLEALRKAATDAERDRIRSEGWEVFAQERGGATGAASRGASLREIDAGAKSFSGGVFRRGDDSVP